VEERVPGCGGVYTAKQGTIAESSTANSEPGGVSCEYEIHLAVGEQVAIQFVRLDLEPQDCLEVLDVTDEGGSVLQEKICGSDAARSNPPAFTSQFNPHSTEIRILLRPSFVIIYTRTLNASHFIFVILIIHTYVICTLKY